MTRLSQVVVLPNGQDVPKLAYGTGKFVNHHSSQITLENYSQRYTLLIYIASKVYQKPCAEKVLNALKSGWRHIDTAQDYGNESSIGQALQLWDGDRKDVYITTKCQSCFVIANCQLMFKGVWSMVFPTPGRTYSKL